MEAENRKRFDALDWTVVEENPFITSSNREETLDLPLHINVIDMI